MKVSSMSSVRFRLADLRALHVETKEQGDALDLFFRGKRRVVRRECACLELLLRFHGHAPMR